MSKLITNTIRHTGASSDSLTFNSDGHATVENNLTVDGTSTLTGNVTASGTLTASNFSGRNIVINGAMNVAQRGNVTGVTSSQYGGPDRFKWVESSDATVTINAPAITSISGFGSAYQVDVTTADASLAVGQYAHIRTALEGRDLQKVKKGFSDAKPLTLSFWVYTNKTGNYTVHMYDADNTRHCSQLYTVSSASTWEKKTLTFPADTTGKFGNDSNKSLEIDWNLAAGTNSTSGTLATTWAAYTEANASAGLNVNILDNTSNEFYLTGVQLEVGDTATEFEHRSYGDELARCQRYYEHSYNTGVAVGASSNVGGYYQTMVSDSSGNAAWSIEYKVQKRAVPSLSFYADDGTANQWDYNLSTASAGKATTTGFRSSLTHLNAYLDVGANWTPCYVLGHWISSSEL